MLFKLAFWKDAIERSLKTGAQFVIGGLGLSEAGPVNAFDLDWQLGVGFALAGLALSLLTSIASAGVGARGTASLTNR